MNTENNVSLHYDISITSRIVSELDDLQRNESSLGFAHIKAIDDIIFAYIVNELDSYDPKKRLRTIENLTYLKQTLAILSNLG